MPAMTDQYQPDGRATRWHGQHARRRAEFVDAALAAIAEHGPDVSTEQIARRAGVARTRLYKHFDGARDLRWAVSKQVSALIADELEPVWNPRGTPMEMITAAVDAHVRWLVEHTHLYRYLLRHWSADSCSEGGVDIKTAIGVRLSELFAGYLHAFGLDSAPAETLAFGLVGYVESSSTRWLDDPHGVSRQTLLEQLTSAIWAVLANALRAGGVELDPYRPLPQPRELRR